MTENSSDQEQTPDKEITLNYIDKLAETLSQINQQRGRVTLIAQVLSVLLLSIAGGVVSLEVLTLRAFDEYNQPVLFIHNSRLVYSVSSWDIQLVGRNLTIREGQGNS
jgi:hypothetical protein